MTSKRPVALITGSTRGIGRETADQLAGHGFLIVICGRDENKARMLAAETNQGGGHAFAVELDVTDDASVAAMAELVEKKLGRVDVLVNNAGVVGPGATSISGTGLDELQSVLDVNLLGAWRVTQAVLPMLRKAAHPRIVNLSTGMGQLEHMQGGWGPYRISKTALNAFTKVVADEEAENRILVNAVCPGWVRTDMGAPGARREGEEGADTVVWLATVGDDGPSGGFFRDRQPIPW